MSLTLEEVLNRVKELYNKTIWISKDINRFLGYDNIFDRSFDYFSITINELEKILKKEAEL